MMNLLTFSYWFNVRGGELALMGNRALVIFCLILAILFIYTIFLKKTKSKLFLKAFNRTQSFCFTNFFIGLLLFILTYERIPLLSARFWFIIWFISMLTWIYFIIKQLKKIPLIKAEYEKKQELLKYLPK